MHENLTRFKIGKSSFRLSSPLLWGLIILETSKLHVGMGLKVLESQFPNLELILVQTDSLTVVLKLPDNDFYARMAGIGHYSS